MNTVHISYGHSKQLWVSSATQFCDGSWSVIIHITDWNCFLTLTIVVLEVGSTGQYQWLVLVGFLLMYTCGMLHVVCTLPTNT